MNDVTNDTSNKCYDSDSNQNDGPCLKSLFGRLDRRIVGVLSKTVGVKGELVGLIVILDALEDVENLRAYTYHVIEICVAKWTALVHINECEVDDAVFTLLEEKVVPVNFEVVLIDIDLISGINDAFSRLLVFVQSLKDCRVDDLTLDLGE